jgi:hypothetical protein
MEDDHTDTVISYIIRPHPISISRMSISIWWMDHILSLWSVSPWVTAMHEAADAAEWVGSDSDQDDF